MNLCETSGKASDTGETALLSALAAAGIEHGWMAAKIVRADGSKAAVPIRFPDGEWDAFLAGHLAGCLPQCIARRKDGSEYVLNDGRALGAYCLSPGEGEAAWVCIWIAWDIDVAGSDHATGCDDQATADRIARRVVEIAEEIGLKPFMERSGSGRGWHVWALFSTSIASHVAHGIARLVADVIEREGMPRIEAFPKSPTPKHDRWPGGSLVFLPFAGGLSSPDGGKLFYSDGSGRRATTVQTTPACAVDALALRILRLSELEAEAVEHERQERVQKLRSGPVGQWQGERIQVPLDVVANALGSVTEQTREELLLDCPRHRSRSRRSLTVDPAGGKWYCFGCAEGGGGDAAAFTLARWLMPIGTDNRDIFNVLRRLSGAEVVA